MPQAQQLGRYHLLDRIAFGGMAEIYRAKTFDKEGHARLVAVKRVLAHLIQDSDFLQMLVDEAKITALLHHDNIARVYEFAKTGDEYFLAMEYVDGKDLRAVLERGRQAGRAIPPEHVAWVAHEIALALHAAHTQRDGAGRSLRIVHRDVSPSNVLCSYHGEVKLCDFGIAKATLTRVQTKTGVIKGKVKYMSPEQAMGRKLDHRSDLFSLGTVMYEMLTLQAPFQAPTEIELIFAVRDARKRSLRELAPDCPDDLVAIVDKAMTRNRGARYQSGEELAADLAAFLEHHQPGYRKTHCSRFMRRIFAEDIERELRQLESWVIGAGDPSQFGQNLIAEVLGPDAQYTKFTAVFGAPSPSELTHIATSDFPRIDTPAMVDLHNLPTMMLDRAALGMAPVVSPSQIAPAPPRDTPGPSNFHDLETALLPSVAANQRSIHDEDTGDRSLPTVEGFGKRSQPADLHAEKTGIIRSRPRKPAASPADLHDRSTMIFMNPAEADTDRKPPVDPAATTPPPERPVRGKTRPLPSLAHGFSVEDSFTQEDDRQPEHPSEESDEHVTPLEEDDLEPV
jgi:serine/threonine-protein kinase